MNPENIIAFFDRRRRAYQQVFSRTNPADQIVLADFAEYCCANRTVFKAGNTDQTAYNAGKRDAFLYLTRAMNLSPDEQFALIASKDHP